MPAHSEQQITPYSTRQLFDLVADIERYPEFLPWRKAAQVLSRHGTEMLGELAIRFIHLSERYRSRVALQPPVRDGDTGAIDVTMVKGPFTHLTNRWRFLPESSGTRSDFSAGFTLIELSIVLVIIGLVVGGILVGRDLIHAAEIRATIGQVETFDAAVNTFQTKFNCLPGDCANASDFGFDPTANGNGDGIIGYCGGANAACNYRSGRGSETANFWYHLSAAGLIANSIGPVAAGNGIAGINSPPVKLAATGGAFEGNHQGWAIAADVPFDAAFGGGALAAHTFALVDNTTALGWNNAGNYTSVDIYALDAKMDDGLPESGTVRAYFFATNDAATGALQVGAFNGTNGVGPGGPNAAVCVRNDTTPPQYNVQYTGQAVGGSCGAVIKAAF